ncbi:MAG: hypothetical protein ACW975_07155 [Candidatus Thorarchaeota archaeon]
MAIEDDQSTASPEDKYAIGVSTQVATVLSLYGKRISAYVGIMLVPIIYSFVFTSIMYLAFGQEMLLYIGYLGSEPVSFFWGMFLLQSEPIPPAVFGPFVGVGGILMLIGFVLNVLVLGAAISIALRTYTGQESAMGSGFSSALERFPTLLAVILIIGSLYAVIMIPIQESLLLMLDAMLIMDLDAMMQASSMLLIMAVVYIFVVTLLYPNAAVVMGDEQSAGRSISRTLSLTRKNFLHTLAGIILFHIIMIVITLAIEFGLVMFLGSDITLLITPFASMLLITPLTYIYQAVLYKDLTARTGQTEQEYW